MQTREELAVEDMSPGVHAEAEAPADPSAEDGRAADHRAVRLAERLLADTREELRRADAKASQWLAVIGAVTMASVATTPDLLRLEREWSHTDRWLSLLALAAAVAAATALVLVLMPRIRGDPDTTHVAYFGHLARIGDPALAQRYLERAAINAMPGLVAELCWISRITMAKYRWLRIGTACATFAAGLALVNAV